MSVIPVVQLLKKMKAVFSTSSCGSINELPSHFHCEMPASSARSTWFQSVAITLMTWCTNVTVMLPSDKQYLKLDSQHSFRKGRSCLSKLLTFLDQLLIWLIQVTMLMLYLWILPKHLTKFLMFVWCVNWSHGITGKLYEWIMNWLSGRKQRVCINGVISELKFVLSGVL